jgi:hypothetical protein
MDKIRPLKFENDVDGSQNDEYQTEADPNEDYVATKGIAFENSNNHYIDKDPTTGQIRFSDPVNGTKILNDFLKSMRRWKIWFGA